MRGAAMRALPPGAPFFSAPFRGDLPEVDGLGVMDLGLGFAVTLFFLFIHSHGGGGLPKSCFRRVYSNASILIGNLLLLQGLMRTSIRYDLLDLQ